jgi:hypothetical protein
LLDRLEKRWVHELLVGWGKIMLAGEYFAGPQLSHNGRALPQDAQKGDLLTRPTPARQDAPFRGQGRSE